MSAAAPPAMPDTAVWNGGADGVAISDETIALVRAAREADVTRAITAATGLVGYDLHKPAQVVVPVFTPIVNSTPREMGVGVDVHHWKAISSFGWETATTGGIPGVVDENQSGPEPTYSVLNLFNVFQTIGAGNSVSFKAQWRGRSLEGDIKAKRMAELIFILKILEEQWLCYYSDYLWQCPTPMAPTTAAAGGTIAAGTYFLAVSARSANGNTPPIAAPASIVTTGTTSTISIVIFTQPLATGYDLWVGTNGTTYTIQVAANYFGGALPTQTIPNLAGSMTLTLISLTTSGPAALPTTNGAMVSKGTNNLPLTNNGIMALIFGGGNQAYGGGVNTAPGATFSASGPLTSTLAANNSLGESGMSCIVAQPQGANGKLQYSDITAMLLAMFQKARANPDCMAVSPYDNNTITNILYNATGTRVNINAAIPDQLGNLTLGQRVTQFLNPTTGKIVQVEIWPYLPQGTILFGSRALPYPIPGFDGPAIKVLTNIDYYGLDYPPTKASPLFSFADYVDETLQISFLGGWGAITGIIPS